MQTDYRYRPATQELTWDGRPAGVHIRTRLIVIGLGLFALTLALFATLFSRTQPPNLHFERFTPSIQTAVRTGDVGFFTSKVVGYPISCQYQPSTLDPAVPCAGLPRDASVRIVDFSEPGGWGMMALPEYRAALAQWLTKADPSQSDEYGDGAVHFYASRCGKASDVSPNECFGYESVLTSIQSTPSGPQRQARLVMWEKSEGKWQITGDRIVGADQPEVLQPLLANSCAYC